MANARHEKEALRQAAELAEAYEGDLLGEARGGGLDEARVRELARRHHGSLVSHTASGRTLTAVVRFKVSYESATLLGASDEFVDNCYSFRVVEGTESGARWTAVPSEECVRR
ncbi:hypothetical protein ACGFZL_14955 [Streptomyces sp. NPDC048182]|uniref:hypothetical protein n=1 Tax=Streptomyces sp. NPDC048182 TaxID=3365507 RepID=UPI00371F5CB7